MNNSKKITMIMAVFAVAVMALAAFVVVDNTNDSSAEMVDYSTGDFGISYAMYSSTMTNRTLGNVLWFEKDVITGYANKVTAENQGEAIADEFAATWPSNPGYDYAIEFYMILETGQYDTATKAINAEDYEKRVQDTDNDEKFISWVDTDGVRFASYQISVVKDVDEKGNPYIYMTYLQYINEDNAKDSKTFVMTDEKLTSVEEIEAAIEAETSYTISWDLELLDLPCVSSLGFADDGTEWVLESDAILVRAFWADERVNGTFIDLNGFTLYANQDVFIGDKAYGGTMIATIEDTSKLGTGNVISNAPLLENWYLNDYEIEILGGTYSVADYGVLVYSASNDNKGTLLIDGATIYCPNVGVWISNCAHPDVEINDTYIEAADIALYLGTVTEATISGSTIIGGNTAVEIKSGTVIISDCSISSSNFDASSTQINGNGSGKGIAPLFINNGFAATAGASDVNVLISESEVFFAEDATVDENATPILIVRGEKGGSCAAESIFFYSDDIFFSDITEKKADGSKAGLAITAVNGATYENVITVTTVVKKAIVVDVYDTLPEAVEAASAGSVITLYKDVELTDGIDVDKEITIDLNGYSITPKAAFASGHDYLLAVKRGGDLTIKDSSDLKTGKVSATINDNPESTVWSAIKMTVKDESATGATAAFTLESGTLEGYYYAITGNGSRHNTSITINGGSVTGLCADDSLAIFHPQDGKLTINGGTFTGYSSALEVRAGEVVINDGTFTATANTISCTASGSGTTTVGAAIAVVQHTTKKDINVSINGGSFTGYVPLFMKDIQGNDTKNVNVYLEGGVFTSINQENPLLIDVKNWKLTVVKGGEISLIGGTISASSERLVNNGTIVVDDADEFVLLVSTYKVGGAVKIASDTSVNTDIDNINVTIDLNGHSLTLKTGNYIKAKVMGGTENGSSGTVAFTEKLYAKGDGIVFSPGSVVISGDIDVTKDIVITIVDGTVKVETELDLEGHIDIIPDGKDTEIVFAGNVTIAADKTMSIGEGVKATIAQDAIVTNNGTIANDGDLVVEKVSDGTNDGKIINNKVINNSVDASLTNNGVIENAAAVSAINNAGSIVNNSTMTLTDGAVTNSEGATLSNTSTGTIDDTTKIDNEGTVENTNKSQTMTPTGSGEVVNGATSGSIATQINDGITDIVLGKDVVISKDAKNESAIVNLNNGSNYYTMTVDGGVELGTTVLGKAASSAFIGLVAGASGYTISAGSVVITGSIDSGTITDVVGKLTLSSVVISGEVIIELDPSVATEVLLDDVTLTGSGSLVIVSANDGDKITVADMTVGGSAGFYVVSATEVAVSIGSFTLNGTAEIGNDYGLYISADTATITITGKLTVSGILDIDNEFAALGPAYVSKIENNGSVIFDLDGDAPVEGIEKMSGNGDVYVNNALIRTTGKNEVGINVVGELVVLQTATGFDTSAVAYWDDTLGTYTDGYSLEFPASAYAKYDDAIVRTIMVAGFGLPSALPITTDVPNAEGWTINGKNYDKNFILIDDGTTPFAPSAANYTVTVYIPLYTITWYDADGYVIQVVTDVIDGTDVLPTYTGSKPVKDATAEYTYTFLGWNTAPGQEIPNITESTKVDHASVKCYPVFKADINEYTISWIDGDGNVIGTDVLEYGETPVYAGADPTKTATEYYSYEWTGDWTPSVDVVVADASYTATFISHAKTPVDTLTFTIAVVGDYVKFTATDLAANEYWAWNAGDVKIKLNFSDTEDTGATAIAVVYELDGVFTIPDLLIPEIEGDLYSVDAKAYAKVDGITKYLGTAEWDAEFTVTFADGEHGTLSGTKVFTELHYGDVMPAAPTVTPDEGYSFTKWSPELPGFVVGTVTYTAQYSPNVHDLTIIINNGVVITPVVFPDVPYNTLIATYLAEKEFDINEYAQIGKEFAGWDPATTNMPDNDLELTATWDDVVYDITAEAAVPSGTYTVKDTEDADIDTAVYGQTVVLNITSAPAGYHLDSWNVTNDTTTESITVTDGKFTMPASDVTISPVFVENVHDLTIVINNGVVITPVVFHNVPYNTDIDDYLAEKEFDITEYTQDGYDFGGWDPATTNMPDNDLTLTATWIPHPYTFTVYMGDNVEYTYQGTIYYDGVASIMVWIDTATEELEVECELPYDIIDGRTVVVSDVHSDVTMRISIVPKLLS